MKLLTVIGTRPQYIKYAALSSALRANYQEVLVDTGQHYDSLLSDAFLQEFSLPKPAHVLQTGNRNDGSHIADMLRGISDIIETEKPDFLLCFGDTNSALAAALAAVTSGIDVVHVEAGERNFSLDGTRIPVPSIPEETNRVLIDHSSSLLLCASERGFSNLIAESVTGRVYCTGDILYDLYLRRIEGLLESSLILDRCGVEADSYCFCTVHRAINTDSRERLSSIVRALVSLDRPVIFPVHPRTRKRLEEWQLLAELEGSDMVRLLEPINHADSLVLTSRASRVITDSGGVLREAYFARVPSVCVDDTTAWVDICHAGWCTLAGSETHTILKAVGHTPPEEYPLLFGDGSAVDRSIAAMTKCY